MTRFATTPFTYRARAAHALAVAAQRRRWIVERARSSHGFGRDACRAMHREWLWDAAAARRLAVREGVVLP